MILTKRPKPKYQPTEKLNVYELNKRISQNQNVITWIGHSTMLISIDGKVILTDPIFSKGVHQFHLLGQNDIHRPLSKLIRYKNRFNSNKS